MKVISNTFTVSLLQTSIKDTQVFAQFQSNYYSFIWLYFWRRFLRLIMIFDIDLSATMITYMFDIAVSLSKLQWVCQNYNESAWC